MTEFKIGDRVRFLPDAAVSKKVLRLTAVVEGYDAVEDANAPDDGTDFVMVMVSLDGKPTSQWVLPREISPA